jgi:hypothetical protein
MAIEQCGERGRLGLAVGFELAALKHVEHGHIERRPEKLFLRGLVEGGKQHGLASLLRFSTQLLPGSNRGSDSAWDIHLGAAPVADEDSGSA